jgi:ATP-dependent DNA helicase RecG
VAHRDYSIQGVSIEVWMFDDRIEVRSPGLPPKPVTVEALNRRAHLHLARNPIIVRVLSDSGYMRDSGEGIPRMFAEMEREGFYPPRFDDIGGVSFQVTLRNQPVYDYATLEWLERFSGFNLSSDQKRLLAYAHAHGDRFTSRDYQKLAGLDIYNASRSIRDLIRKGIVHPIGKGSRIYRIGKPVKALPEMPEEFIRVLPILRQRGQITNEDVRNVLGVARNTASRRLREWTDIGWLQKRGSKKWTAYEPGANIMHQPLKGLSGPFPTSCSTPAQDAWGGGSWPSRSAP